MNDRTKPEELQEDIMDQAQGAGSTKLQEHVCNGSVHDKVNKSVTASDTRPQDCFSINFARIPPKPW